MKRYALFAGARYYAAGGWRDFRGDFDEIDQAAVTAEVLIDQNFCDWWQIVDIESGQQVSEYSEACC